MSDEFKELLGGVRTRRLAQLIAPSGPDSAEFKKAIAVLEICGIAPKEKKGKKSDDEDSYLTTKAPGLVYVSKQAVNEMSELLKARDGEDRSTTWPSNSRDNRSAIQAQPGHGALRQDAGTQEGEKEASEESSAKPEGGDVWKGLNTNH